MGKFLAAVSVGAASLHAEVTAQTGSDASTQQTRPGGTETRLNFVFIRADDLVRVPQFRGRDEKVYRERSPKPDWRSE
jgi:hypothetical protein